MNNYVKMLYTSMQSNHHIMKITKKKQAKSKIIQITTATATKKTKK